MISLLDNESQLAFLLAHEAGHVMLSHHVQQVIEEEKAENRAGKIKMIGTAAGALAGDLRRHLMHLPLKGVSNRSLPERWRKWRRRCAYSRCDAAHASRRCRADDFR